MEKEIYMVLWAKTSIVKIFRTVKRFHIILFVPAKQLQVTLILKTENVCGGRKDYYPSFSLDLTPCDFRIQNL